MILAAPRRITTLAVIHGKWPPVLGDHLGAKPHIWRRAPPPCLGPPCVSLHPTAIANFASKTSRVGLAVITMKWNTLAAAGLVAPATALLRFPCSSLTVQRLDPLVNPGQNPSTHLHQIVGGVRYLPISSSDSLWWAGG